MYEKRHIVDMLDLRTVKQRYRRAERMRKISIMPHEKGKKTKGVKCPYLSNGPKRICTKMVEAGLDARVSRFDVKHFCKGNPNNCYFFRISSPKQKSSA